MDCEVCHDPSELALLNLLLDLIKISLESEKLGLKMHYFIEKILKIAGGSAPRSLCLRRLGALPPDPHSPFLLSLGFPDFSKSAGILDIKYLTC